MNHRRSRALLTVTGASLALGLGAGSALASAPQAKPEGTPIFLDNGSLAAGQQGQNGQQGNQNSAFKSFMFNFTDPTNNTTYPITMIGTDPLAGNRSSDVKTVISPLKMNFVAGGQDTSSLNDLGYVGFRAPALNHTFDGSRRVDAVLKSPIYSKYQYPSDLGGDRAQFGDAFMRAQFNKIGTGYHVMLDKEVTPIQTLNVPASDGLAYQRPVGAWRTEHGMPTDTIAGVADYDWFVTQIENIMVKLDIGPDAMPIFLTDNVMLYIGAGNYLNCCVIGFHGTPAQGASTASTLPTFAPNQTLMYAAWSTPGTYSGFMTDYTGVRSAPRATRGISDIHALSHEVAEAFDDPFVNNAVTPWLTPTAPQYGCTGLLEVGDPVVGVWFGLDGNKTGKQDGFNYYGQYHPEDNVFAQWFGRGGIEAAGYHSWDGRFTFMGPRTTGIGGGYTGFGSYAQGC